MKQRFQARSTWYGLDRNCLKNTGQGRHPSRSLTLVTKRNIYRSSKFISSIMQVSQSTSGSTILHQASFFAQQTCRLKTSHWRWYSFHTDSVLETFDPDTLSLFCFVKVPKKVWSSAGLLEASTNYAMQADILRMEIGKISLVRHVSFLTNYGFAQCADMEAYILT